MKVSLDTCLKNNTVTNDAGQIIKMMSLDDMFILVMLLYVSLVMSLDATHFSVLVMCVCSCPPVMRISMLLVYWYCLGARHRRWMLFRHHYRRRRAISKITQVAVELN